MIKLKTTYRKPFYIDILFLEINAFQNFKQNFLKEIDTLGCVQIVLIVDTLKNMISAINFLKFSKIEIIHVITKYSKRKNDEIKELRDKESRLRYVTFYKCPENECNSTRYVTYTSLNIDKVLTKKISSTNDFIVNQNAFIESLNYNLFFNRKVYIDNHGNVKHYFNDKKIYGNITQNDLKDIILTDSFQELWKVVKDKIEGCKDCEFRYICPDNRIPILITPNVYSHETLCKYDPKEAKWI